MDTPVSLAYKLVFVAIVYTGGYFMGYKPQHDRLVILRATIEQMGKDQATEVKRKDDENEKQSQAVAADYLAERNFLLKRLQDRTGSSTLPEDAKHPQDAARADRERTNACERTQFYANAMKCELQLKGIRRWVDVQRIPVE